MHPLSIIKFYMNNKKRLAGILIAIALSTFLLYVMQMLLDSLFLTSYNAFVEPQKYYSSITSKGRTLNEALVEEMANLDSVERVMPWVFRFTNFYSNIGGNTGTKVFTVKHDDMLILMDKLQLTVKEGRLPEAGSREIAVHYQIAQNKNLKVGDKIGSNIDRDEYIQGERIIVGLLGGRSLVSFESLETWLQDNQVTFEPKMGIILLPRSGMEQQLNRYLDSLNLTGLEIRTLESVSRQNARDTENIKTILTFLSLLVVVIVSFCTGFLCYMYYSQRRTEFGFLNAIGYSRQYILNRVIREIGVLNACGFGGGILLALTAGYAIDWLAYAPKGQIIRLWSTGSLAAAAAIPLFATLFSIIPIWLILNQLDTVAVLEGSAGA